MKDQSKETIEQQTAGSKRQQQQAGCEGSRPACCPSCGAPSRPLGGRVQLHGHGQRKRTQRGPRALGEPPEESTVAVRRYLCKQCGATVTVRPRDVLRGRLYSATAIGLGLALFGLEGRSPHAVRQAIAPAPSRREQAEGATWSTLRRWAQQAKAGMLTEEGRPSPATFTLRKAAERLAAALGALGRRVGGMLERVWEGALEAHWRGAS